MIEEVEKWKDLPGFEGYQVSNMGLARNIKKTPFKILKFDEFNGGYLRFTASKGNVQKRFIIHRIVAQLFIPNPEDKPHVNHKKGIKYDNRASELEWVTASENEKHAHKYLGKIPPDAKTVIDIETGIFYDSISKAAIAKNLTPSALLTAIQRKKNKTTIMVV